MKSCKPLSNLVSRKKEDFRDGRHVFQLSVVKTTGALTMLSRCMPAKASQQI